MCATLSSSHAWDNHKEGIIMTTYIHPLAMLLMDDEICNFFNMLLSNKQRQTFTNLTCSLLNNMAGDILQFSYCQMRQKYQNQQ